jgi:hypothetical protein
LTPDLVAFLKEREKKFSFRETKSEEGKLVYSKEEKGEDGTVTVFATQKNVRVEKKAAKEPGKTTEEKVEETRNHKVVLKQEGTEWRVAKWLEECGSCKGKGTCPDCDGTGKTKDKKCFSCKGTGKDEEGKECFMCGGTGKEKPQECFRCKETGGKCGICEGKGWKEELDFKEDPFLLDEEWKVEKIEDLGSPAGTAKSYINLKDRHQAEQLGIVRKVIGEMRALIEAFCTLKVIEGFRVALKKSGEQFRKQQDVRNLTFGEPKVDGDTAVVEVSETSLSRKGETRTEKTALKIVKKDGKWLIDDRGGQCWSCKGSGKCSECDGTGKTKEKECWSCKGSGKNKEGKECFGCGGSGKTKPSDCFMCKETGGKCGSCKGGKFNWDRAEKN